MQMKPESREQPLVGLGMPVFNGERYVAQAIRSILAQSYDNFELVICDNASTDGTEMICRELAASDRRVRYHRNPENVGAHPNFNRAFELSRGKYFKWTADDDVLDPDYLSACVDMMEAHPKAVVCQSQFDFIDAAGNRIGICGTDLAEAQSSRPHVRFAAATLKAHNCYEVMGVFRREFLMNSNLLTSSSLLMSFHGGDRAFLAQLTLLGPFLHISRPLLQVRDHKDRYTRSITKPKDRATWLDARFKGKLAFPTWRLYREYWVMLAKSELGAAAKSIAALKLLQWWFVNWNAARAIVDVCASFVPGIVGWAERLKQDFFSPAPGIDRLRKGRQG